MIGGGLFGRFSGFRRLFGGGLFGRFSGFGRLFGGGRFGRFSGFGRLLGGGLFGRFSGFGRLLGGGRFFSFLLIRGEERRFAGYGGAFGRRFSGGRFGRGRFRSRRSVGGGGFRSGIEGFQSVFRQNVEGRRVGVERDGLFCRSGRVFVRFRRSGATEFFFMLFVVLFDVFVGNRVEGFVGNFHASDFKREFRRLREPRSRGIGAEDDILVLFVEIFRLRVGRFFDFRDIVGGVKRGDLRLDERVDRLISEQIIGGGEGRGAVSEERLRDRIGAEIVPVAHSRTGVVFADVAFKTDFLAE